MAMSGWAKSVVGLTAVLSVAGAILASQGAASMRGLRPPPAAESKQTPIVGTPGAPGVGDSVYPNLGNGGYQVGTYLIDVEYSGLTRLVNATVTVHARATQHLSQFNLDAYGLDIETVAVNDAPARFAQQAQELVVTPARVLPKDAMFAVKIGYRADPRRIRPPAGGFVATADGFATAPQPAGAHTIFPSNDHPSDKAFYVFRVTAPEGLLGVASGTRLGQRRNPDGSTTSTYASRHPIATEVVQISVGRYTIVDHGRHDGARLRDVVPTARLEQLRPALDLTAAQLAWIKPRLGRFPLEAYGLLPADTDAPDAFDFTGLETQTLTLYKPAYLTQPEEKIGTHMMHEIVHNWFGNSVTPKDWSDLWLNEGNANYYSFRYQYERGWTDSRGFTTMHDRMKYTYSQGDIWRRTSGPVARPNAVNLFDGQRYTGGTLVLYALSKKVGQATFDRIQREFLRRYQYRNAGTEDYIALATTISGNPSVRPFLQDWLYGAQTPPMPGHPDWTVEPATGPIDRQGAELS